MRVSSIKEIDTLFKEGKISRTTYWRAKKRGWCEIDYHKRTIPKNADGSFLVDIEKLYSFITIKAKQYINAHIEPKYAPNTLSIVQDVVQEYMLYVVEKQLSVKQAFSFYKHFIPSVCQRNKMYKKYFIFADSLTHLSARRAFDAHNKTLF